MTNFMKLELLSSIIENYLFAVFWTILPRRDSNLSRSFASFMVPIAPSILGTFSAKRQKKLQENSYRLLKFRLSRIDCFMKD